MTVHVHRDGRLTVTGPAPALDLELRPNPAGYAVHWHGARIGLLVGSSDAISDTWTGWAHARVVAEARDEGTAALELAAAWLAEELEGLARAQTRAHREQIARTVSGAG